MTEVGASGGPVARSSVARVGTATALTAVCGYAVIYLAARDLAPSGFSVFGVFWGAFAKAQPLPASHELHPLSPVHCSAGQRVSLRYSLM